MLALGIFGGAAASPWLHNSVLDLPGWVQSIKAQTPVQLLGAPASLPAVKLVASAEPAQPNGTRATLPTVNAAHQAALVATEDVRLRTLLHRSARLVVPTVVKTTAGPPTLVLPARPLAYTSSDLIAAGALTPLSQKGTALLVDSVLIVRGASLALGDSSLTKLLMSDTPDQFTSIVSWGGTLSLSGTAAVPLTITGWNPTTGRPAIDNGRGRSYIRAVGSHMDLHYVHASALGFGSGRTGGVAWTGSSNQPSTGVADSSTFTGDVFGAFLSRTERVRLSNDLFEANEIDGVRLHRYADHTIVSLSAAARNGGSGIVVDRGAPNNLLSGDLSMNNTANGYVLDGRSLVSGPSASGVSATPSSGNVVTDSAAAINGRSGILVEGGQGTAVVRNTVCAAATSIALRDGATGTTLTGNETNCMGRVGLLIGLGVTGTTVTGNTFSLARIGVLVRGAVGVRLVGNWMTGIGVYGISLRGATPGVVGYSNTISGHGFSPVDVHQGTIAPSLSNTLTSGWTRRSNPTPISYLMYHPILSIWGGLVLLVVLATILFRLRRRPQRLYAHTFSSPPIRPAVRVAPHPVPVLVSALVAEDRASAEDIVVDVREPMVGPAYSPAGDRLLDGDDFVDAR